MGKRYEQRVIVIIEGACLLTGFVMGLSGEGLQEMLSANMVTVLLLLFVASFAAFPVNRFVSESSVGEHRLQMENKVYSLKNNVETLQDECYMKERVSKAKSKFMNRMSHDLRTPMNAIMGYSMLMEQVCDEPDKVEDYARKIQVSSRTLLELINDVLDMSSIETGNVKLLNSEFSLTSALDEIKSSIRPQAETKGQQFNFYMTNSSDKDRIVGDKRRFCQVLRNLLSNATKYTPEGGSIDMMVNIIETGSNELQFLCQIKDTGCGMSEDFAERLFRPFEREDNVQNDNVQGTGLGMCIAKSFIDLMNGEITVESKLNIGTLVTVRIPLTPVKDEKNIMPGMFENQEVIKGLRFLVAEDNEMNAEILQEVLAAMGAQCVMTENGQAVVEVFEASDPDEFDMVLMDIQMPVMDGYQATAALRKCKHPRAKEIVILAMTADAFEEDVQKAFVSGMDGHVAKPLDLQSFISTVDSLKKRMH